jgi:hypothetical protein
MAIIDIDQTWYDANLPAEGTYFPVLMTGAGNTYRLVGNITANGSGLIFGANDQTLNLNGFTLTYDNQAAITVPNGDFETGVPGNPPPNWNVNGAPGFQIAVNGTSGSPYLWGNQVGMFIAPNNHVIKSDTITIPSIYQGLPLWAMVTASGGSATTTLRVKDAVTDVLLVEATESQAVLTNIAAFTPSASTITNGVYLEVQGFRSDLANYAVDRVVIRPLSTCGVICSDSPWGLPAYLQVPYINAAIVNKGTVLGPGSIVQGGSAKSVRSYAFNTAGMQDMTIDNVTVSMIGDDPIGIGDYFTGHRFIIKSCTFNHPNGAAAGRPDYNITRRNIQFAAIKLSPSGTVNIENNIINDCPQCGIQLASWGTLSPAGKITGNVISLNVNITNGWGIMLQGSANEANLEVGNNTITAGVGKSGRGIMIDALAGTTKNVEIHHNTINVRERGNREFGTAGLECQGLKLRSFGASNLKDLNIHDNTFAATTDDTLVHACQGVGVGWTSTGNTGIVFSNNICRATVTGTDATYWARAISFREHKELVTSTNDTFDSNDVSIGFHDNDGFGLVDGVDFVNPTIVKNAAAPPTGITHLSYEIGDAGLTTSPIKNLRVFSPNYSGGATSAFQFKGSGNPKDVSFGHLVTVNVQDGVGAPVQDATVSWKDNEESVIFDIGTTGPSGQLASMKVVEAVHQQLTSNPASITIDDEKPQVLVINHADFNPLVEGINITGDDTVTRQLQGGPVPPPSMQKNLVLAIK